ncbi:penicillin binding protein PBP4B [Alteromonas sediminis]|uniref:Penicillin binding protein PBP4B n=2 Tax=Alteromonas sediminis TaxID=2259342 RepID=A0A3N5ZB35_9ALTE|nr:penicillin binding protein PBP4B [Alteromonas sediminis]
MSKMAFFILALIGVSSCASNSYEQLPSKNYSERVKFLVMHFTAIDYQKSVNALVEPGNVSSHYLLPENYDISYPYDVLKVMQLVHEHDRAWHAGRSYWQGRENINDQSIGIEIVNVPQCEYDSGGEGSRREHGEGRMCVFPDYDPEQIQMLITLSKDILARNPDIGPTQVVGHSDIAPTRKNDPGPRFPWYELYKAGIGAWYEVETVKKYWQQFNDVLPSVGLVQKALRTYGYGQEETGRLDPATIDTLSAFQMHFVPWRVTGQMDSQTLATLFALIDRYFPEKVESLMQAYTKEVSDIPVLVESKVKRGQIDRAFGDVSLTENPLTDNRLSFQSYQGRGEITIQNINAESASIFVNGEKLNIADPLKPLHEYVYPLSRRTIDGANRLYVESISPADGQIEIRIPYPRLIDKTEQYEQRFSTVDKLIQQDVKNGFPGAVLLVVKDGEIVKRTAYGYSRKYADGGIPLTQPVEMKTDTLFDLASNTKMFATNLALMKLVSEEKLDVNLPVSAYIPEYRGGGREARLVRDLLTHTAGYAPEVRFFDSKNPLGKRFFSQNRSRTESLLLTRVPLVSDGSNAPVYSDTDYMLLGVLVEKVAGMPLDDYVEHELYHPLGLKNTLFNPLHKGFGAAQFAATEIQGNTRGGRITFDNIRQHVLQGEVHDEKAFYSSGGIAGHAGLFSTADDLAVLAQLMLNRGGYGDVELINGKVVDSFVKPEENDATYGLGWRRASEGEKISHFGPYASASAFGHTGWTGTVSVIDPEHDLAIIYLTNLRHTPLVDNEESGLEFKGRSYESGRYGNVISLVYEALLNH